jgi:1-acyl-sn-glycerol-3-phosphate acyltransferase
MGSGWVRRPITVGGMFMVAILLTLLLPVWLVVGVLVDVVRRHWRLPSVRLLSFAWCWSWLESIGVAVAVVLWILGQGRNQRAHYALQRWWAARLIGSLRVTCGLAIVVEGADTLPDGPIVCLGRHASLGDALVSAWAFGSVAHRFPRYVMKKELALDPCLDIVGRRIPNYFVDRDATASRREIEGIVAMATGMGPRDVAVIGPEGTRTNDAKRARAIARLEARAPERHDRMSGLQRLLPPKPGGAEALIESVPDADVVVMWHVGFDGLDTFGGIFRRLTRAEPAARVVMDLHDRSTVETGTGFVGWLDARWLEIDAKVVEADLVRHS